MNAYLWLRSKNKETKVTQSCFKTIIFDIPQK